MKELSDEMVTAIITLLKDNLTIDVKTTSEYTGGMDGSNSLYKDSHTILLKLDGEVISEAYLD